MYIYHALINALSAHIIYINLNIIFYTHVEDSPTKTIHIRHYTHTHTHARTHARTHAHIDTHTHTHTHTHFVRGKVARRCPETTFSEKESRSGESNRFRPLTSLTAYQLTSLTAGPQWLIILGSWDPGFLFTKPPSTHDSFVPWQNTVYIRIYIMVSALMERKSMQDPCACSRENKSCFRKLEIAQEDRSAFIYICLQLFIVYFEMQYLPHILVHFDACTCI